MGLHEYRLDDHRVIEYLGAISSTCSVWRDAALGTPSLWQRIIYKDHSEDLYPKYKGPPISRHTKDRLLTYLSRSKGCSILLHLAFGTSPLRTQAIKRILHPHLPRCLSISLNFRFEYDVGNFLPLPGNLCRLTEFTCIARRGYWHELHTRISPPPIFAEPERVSLRKLILNKSRPSVDGINTQNLEDFWLIRKWDEWPEGTTFISRCHSLTTLIMSDEIPSSTGQPLPSFTLPNLIYLDIFGLTMLTAAHTPNLQTLILEVYDHEFASAVIQLPSWPVLTTLCFNNAKDSEEIRSLLGLNPHIRRLMLTECRGIQDIIQSLKAEDTALLPSLRLLQVFDPDWGDYHSLFAHRPTLRIEYGLRCGPSYIGADELKATVEELGHDGEPGVFQLSDFGPGRCGVVG